MTKRLHPCLTCEPNYPPSEHKHGLTRHESRVCSWCRRRGVTVGSGVIRIPIAAKVEAFMDEHMPDLELTPWQREALRATWGRPFAAATLAHPRKREGWLR